MKHKRQARRQRLNDFASKTLNVTGPAAGPSCPTGCFRQCQRQDRCFLERMRVPRRWCESGHSEPRRASSRWVRTDHVLRPLDRRLGNTLWNPRRLQSGLNTRNFLEPGNKCPVVLSLSLIHISEPTRLGMLSYAVFCLKKKKKKKAVPTY